jgi:hypothetical protein
MAVSASPAARAVRTACFAEQMEQKKYLLITSSQKNYPPAFHSLKTTALQITNCVLVFWFFQVIRSSVIGVSFGLVASIIYTTHLV